MNISVYCNTRPFNLSHAIVDFGLQQVFKHLSEETVHLAFATEFKRLAKILRNFEILGKE
jgi:hypothetical protein